MPSIKYNITIPKYQQFTKDIYGLSNDRYFDTDDMLINIQTFIMRGIKGIRKKDEDQTKLNLLVAQSWFFSLLNQLHINFEEVVWKRFPYACSYCTMCPCSCTKNKVKRRKQIVPDETKRPKTFADFQQMFSTIYSPEKRTLADSGIHLAEELGELSEAIFRYRGLRRSEDFAAVTAETADLFSCLMGVFNSLNVDVAKELSLLFINNCHVCKKAPCECSFDYIKGFKW